MRADLGSHVKEHANSGYCEILLYNFKLFLCSFQFRLPTLIIFHVCGIASVDRDVAARRSVHEEGSSTPAMSCFVLRETEAHGVVAEYRRLYSNLHDARRFGAMLSDGRNSRMFDRLGICRVIDFGA